MQFYMLALYHLVIFLERHYQYINNALILIVSVVCGRCFMYIRCIVFACAVDPVSLRWCFSACHGCADSAIRWINTSDSLDSWYHQQLLHVECNLSWSSVLASELSFPLAKDVCCGLVMWTFICFDEWN